MGSLATTTTTHLGNTNTLTQTIAGTGHGNMMVIPGPPGTIVPPPSWLHVHGSPRFRPRAMFKILPMEDATKPIEGTASGRPSTHQGVILECPTLDKMIGAKTEEEFKKLQADGNEILKGKPNHLLVLPEVFFMANGNKTFSSKWMAIKIIERLRPQDSDDDDMKTARMTEAKLLATFLAFLWASENKSLVPIGRKPGLEPNGPKREGQGRNGNPTRTRTWRSGNLNRRNCSNDVDISDDDYGPQQDARIS